MDATTFLLGMLVGFFIPIALLVAGAMWLIADEQKDWQDDRRQSPEDRARRVGS